MTLQPTAVIFPDAELVVTSFLRPALAARPEAFASGVYVSNKKPAQNGARTVVVRRDGGLARGVLEYPRITVRVWAAKEQDASDLARLVQALLLTMPGTGPVVNVTSLSGPQGIPDESQPQKLLTVELTTRGVPL